MATTSSVKWNKRRKRVDALVATMALTDVGGGVALVSGDTVELFALPAGAVVTDVIVNKKTVFNAGTSAVLSVGDGGSGTRYHSTIDVKTAVGMVAATAIPYQYTVSDTIDGLITLVGTAATTGELEVEVLFFSPNEDVGFMSE